MGDVKGDPSTKRMVDGQTLSGVKGVGGVGRGVCWGGEGYVGLHIFIPVHQGMWIWHGYHLTAFSIAGAGGQVGLVGWIISCNAGGGR